jgi:hypothetical protein
MAIEQLFEALPLHYLQHGISRFGAANVALAAVITAVLGVLADYAWMLHLRSKMVRGRSRASSIMCAKPSCSHPDRFRIL